MVKPFLVLDVSSCVSSSPAKLGTEEEETAAGVSDLAAPANKTSLAGAAAAAAPCPRTPGISGAFVGIVSPVVVSMTIVDVVLGLAFAIGAGRELCAPGFLARIGAPPETIGPDGATGSNKSVVSRFPDC